MSVLRQCRLMAPSRIGSFKSSRERRRSSRRLFVALAAPRTTRLRALRTSDSCLATNFVCSSLLSCTVLPVHRCRFFAIVMLSFRNIEAAEYVCGMTGLTNRASMNFDQACLNHYTCLALVAACINDRIDRDASGHACASLKSSLCCLAGREVCWTSKMAMIELVDSPQLPMFANRHDFLTNMLHIQARASVCMNGLASLLVVAMESR
jgi:hypothetical protein